MVCTSTDDSDSDSVALVPSCVTIDNVDTVSGVQVVDGTFSVDLPDLLFWSAMIQGISCDLERCSASRGRAWTAGTACRSFVDHPEPLLLPESKSGVKGDVWSSAPQSRLRLAKTIRAPPSNRVLVIEGDRGKKKKSTDIRAHLLVDGTPPNLFF